MAISSASGFLGGQDRTVRHRNIKHIDLNFNRNCGFFSLLHNLRNLNLNWQNGSSKKKETVNKKNYVLSIGRLGSRAVSSVNAIAISLIFFY